MFLKTLQIIAVVMLSRNYKMQDRNLNISQSGIIFLTLQLQMSQV